jgi:hypothetical protein
MRLNPIPAMLAPVKIKRNSASGFRLPTSIHRKCRPESGGLDYDVWRKRQPAAGAHVEFTTCPFGLAGTDPDSIRRK